MYIHRDKELFPPLDLKEYYHTPPPPLGSTPTAPSVRVYCPLYVYLNPAVHQTFLPYICWWCLVASMLARALESARCYRQVRDRLAELSKSNTVLDPTDVGVLAGVLDAYPLQDCDWPELELYGLSHNIHYDGWRMIGLLRDPVSAFEEPGLRKVYVQDRELSRKDFNIDLERLLDKAETFFTAYICSRLRRLPIEVRVNVLAYAPAHGVSQDLLIDAASKLKQTRVKVDYGCQGCGLDKSRSSRSVWIDVVGELYYEFCPNCTEERGYILDINGIFRRANDHFSEYINVPSFGFKQIEWACEASWD